MCFERESSVSICSFQPSFVCTSENEEFQRPDEHAPPPQLLTLCGRIKPCSSQTLTVEGHSSVGSEGSKFTQVNVRR